MKTLPECCYNAASLLLPFTKSRAMPFMKAQQLSGIGAPFRGMKNKLCSHMAYRSQLWYVHLKWCAYVKMISVTAPDFTTNEDLEDTTYNCGRPKQSSGRPISLVDIFQLSENKIAFQFSEESFQFVAMLLHICMFRKMFWRSSSILRHVP